MKFYIRIFGTLIILLLLWGLYTYLSKTNIDFLIPFNFSSRISNISPPGFIDFILSKINPKSILIGYDNKFGKDRNGDFEFLLSMR